VKLKTYEFANFWMFIRCSHYAVVLILTLNTDKNPELHLVGP